MNGFEGFVATLVTIAMFTSGLAVVDYRSQPPKARVAALRQFRVILLVSLLALAAGVLILWVLT